MTFTVGEVYAPEWIRWMRLPNGKPPRMDWYGHNPYSTREPNLKLRPTCPGCATSATSTPSARSQEDYKKRDAADLPVRVRGALGSPEPDLRLLRHQQQQAGWLTAGYRIAHRHRWIAGLGWWTLVDGPVAADSTNSGLLRADGTPKPSYYAYRRAR